MQLSDKAYLTQVNTRTYFFPCFSSVYIGDLIMAAEFLKCVTKIKCISGLIHLKCLLTCISAAGCFMFSSNIYELDFINSNQIKHVV